VKLREIAHARTGDKGDTSNIAIIAFNRDDYEHLRAEVTSERISKHLGHILRGEVVRYEMPELGALNFVLHRALAGGVTRSLALDAHGKCLSSCVLGMEIPARAQNETKPKVAALRRAKR